MERAGGPCLVEGPTEIGETRSSPVRGAGIELATSGEKRWAGWRVDDDRYAVQPLDESLRPSAPLAKIEMARPRGTVSLVGRDDMVLIATHASCTKRLTHCLGLRWLDANGLPVADEWEYPTKRGDPVSAQHTSLRGEEVLAYTYRYWSPLIVHVPLPGTSGPRVRELVEAPTRTDGWKLAMVPSADGDTVGLLVSFVTDSRKNRWQLRWYPHDDVEGREILSGDDISNLSLEPRPPFAVRTRDGVHVSGRGDPDAAWQLQLDASAQPVGGIESVTSTSTVPARSRDVRVEVVFEKRKMILRRTAWGAGQLEDVVVAEGTWHRSGPGAATVAWLGDSFAVAVAEYDKPSWRFLAYRVRCPATTP